MVDLVNNIKNRPLNFPRQVNNIDKVTEDVIRKMLVVDPKKRISLDEALEHRWFKILDAPRKCQRKAITRTTRSKYASIL